MKIKLDKWYYTKLTDFCMIKETIKRIKRQHKEWGKIFGNSISDGELTS
jgi:hypothetical protein